jgi:hypothetical protein
MEVTGGDGRVKVGAVARSADKVRSFTFCSTHLAWCRPHRSKLAETDELQRRIEALEAQQKARKRPLA